MSRRCTLGLVAVFAGLFFFGPVVAHSAPKSRVIEKTMAKSELEAVVARGAQRFIATLRVEPHMVGGRFIGYQIAGFTADSPLLRGDSIRAGDVIISVNEESLERPEQFMKAWKVASSAKVLQVTLLRSGEKLRYRWRLM